MVQGVSAEFVYYAKIPNGVILEAYDLKTVYYAALREMKAEYGHGLFFVAGSVVICSGFRVDWWNGHCWEFKHMECDQLLRISVSSCDRITNTHIEKMEV